MPSFIKGLCKQLCSVSLYQIFREVLKVSGFSTNLKKVSGLKVSGFLKMYQVFINRLNFVSGQKFQNLILLAKPDKKTNIWFILHLGQKRVMSPNVIRASVC